MGLERLVETSSSEKAMMVLFDILSGILEHSVMDIS